MVSHSFVSHNTYVGDMRLSRGVARPVDHTYMGFNTFILHACPHFDTILIGLSNHKQSKFIIIYFEVVDKI